MKLYLISGLGADHRAFEKLQFPDGYELVHIPWIDALPGESLQGYARRMAGAISKEEPFVLGGLSFGGMVAVEICKFLRPEKLILFSTVASNESLPWYYRLAGRARLYKLLPQNPPRPFMPFLFWFFGPLNKSGRDVLRYFASLIKPNFLKWALTQISTWQNTERPCDVISIHGEKDRTFPLRYIRKPGHIIKGAGHLAVYTHAREVSDLLEYVLES
jgi:pimeloyl-ACP methyl ester carboxylesterase